MLQSMTGFGSAQAENDRISVTAEVKTLNSKYTDTYCRIPKNYSNREVELRSFLSSALKRGKIEFTLNVVAKDESSAGTALNKPVVKAYYKDLLATAKELGFEPNYTELLKVASNMPNAFQVALVDEEEAEVEWKTIMSAVEKAIQKCIEFRQQEGEATKQKFIEYIKNIDLHLQDIITQDPNRIPAIRERIGKSISEYVESDNFDQNRFEQELIYYIEKYDISEEKVRLKNHLEYFLKELTKNVNGKRLNFITQEIGREINTIGSKANDAVIQRSVVKMKDELEKIKEQTLNIV